jgi:hypothetical protein
LGPYTGDLSPWSAPTVSAPLGTQVYKGTTYNRYQVTWSTAQSWSGPTPGEVVGGATFHVGTGFSGIDYNASDAIIITDVELLDSGGNPLALHPRIVAFDDGALDAADGAFVLNVANFNESALILSDLRVVFLARWLSIDAMLARAKQAVDIFGQPISPWGAARLDQGPRRIAPKVETKLSIRKFSDGPHLLQVTTKTECGTSDNLTGAPDVANCKPGTTASLFPSTSTYLTAVVTDPAAKQWDPESKAYRTGPLSTRIFYQFVGHHPDLNRNGIDDFVDIRSNRELDRDGNGVIDVRP